MLIYSFITILLRACLSQFLYPEYVKFQIIGLKILFAKRNNFCLFLGFYRVNYDNNNWKLLVYQLRRNPNQIPVATRGQLIDDAFQLANAGILNYTIAFDLVKYLYITEQNYIPWYSALRNLEELRLIISNYEYSGMYDNFLLKLVKPMFNELKAENRSQNEKLLRLHIVTSACKLRYGKCITWARNRYYEWMEMPNPDGENP